MPELTASEVWQVVLGRMENIAEIRATVAAVFRSLTLESCENGEVKLLAPNGFVLKTVQDRHTAVIQRHLEEVLGGGISLILELNPNPPKFEESLVAAPPAPQSSAADKPARPVVREPEGDFRSSKLVKAYTFESFISASCNTFAYGHLKLLADERVEAGDQLDQLEPPGLTVVWGSPGIGKSHIVQGMVHRIREGNPYIRAAYLTPGDFTRLYVLATGARGGPYRMGEMDDFFLNLDVLVFDDIQDIVGSDRKGTISKFWEIFNFLLDSGKMLVLVCDVNPHTIGTQNDRYVTRLQKGTIARLREPDREVFEQILLKKAEAEECPLEPERLLAASKRLRPNPRIAEGVICAICAFGSLYPKSKISDKDLHEILEDYESVARAQTVSIEAIVAEVAARTAVPATDIFGSGREKKSSQSRHLAFSCCRVLLPGDVSLQQIGNSFSGRDHSTVLYGLRKAHERASEDPRVMVLINEVLAVFGHEPMEAENLPSGQ